MNEFIYTCGCVYDKDSALENTIICPFHVNGVWIHNTKKEDQTNPKDLIGQTKTPLSLIPPAGIEEIAKAMKNGSDKYGPYNWRDKKVQYMIYLDAILRHTMALIEKEDFAEDSGVHHLGHIGANTAILLDAIKHDCLIDNRPKKVNKDGN